MHPSRDRLLIVARALLVPLAAAWLGYQGWRLLWQPPPLGAVDLGYRHQEVRAWFSGAKVYRELGAGIYPPASYAILWPALGWLSFSAARWLWAAVFVAGLWRVVKLLVEASAVTTALERGCLTLCLLALGAAGAGMGNGQIGLPALACALSAIEFGERNHGRGLRSDLLCAGLFLVGLVKPTVTAPFFWLIALSPRPATRVIAIVFGYLALTLLAAAFQPAGIGSLLGHWLDKVDAKPWLGSGDLHVSSLLERLGLGAWSTLASLAVLGALGIWLARHRAADSWLRLGVTALVARVWTQHWWHDDTLVAVTAIALLRLAGNRQHPRARLAAAIGVTTLTAMLLPGGKYVLPRILQPAYLSLLGALWLAAGAFLIAEASRIRRGNSP